MGRNGRGWGAAVAGAVAVVAIAAGVAAQAGSPARDAEAAARIAQASRAFSAAYVAGDTAAIRELYTEDALLLPPGRDVRGRDAVVRYFAPGPRRENLTHAMESEKLDVRGDAAIDVGTWRNRWRIDGGEPSEAEGRYLVVWRRGDDGRWRIAYDMWHRPAA